MDALTDKKIETQDLVVDRILDAPIDRVWNAWTDPNQVMRWWGPQHYTSPSCKIDLREGGRFIFAMRAPVEQGGQDSFSSGVFKRIIPRQLLEFTMSLSDQAGSPVEPCEVGMPADFPKLIRTVIAFKPLGLMTELTITEYDWPVGQMYVYSLAGMHQSIDKLAGVLAKP